MADIELDYAVPSADLSDYITLFYRFEADVPVFEDTERADHAQLRFGLAPGRAVYSFVDGVVQSPANLHLVGPTSGAFQVRAEGPVRLFGAGITAAGWAALIGNDASSMLNRTVDVATVFGSAMRDAAAALRLAGTTAEMVAIVEPLIRKLVAEREQGAVDFMHQVDAWLAASPSPEIETLVAAAGVTRRQVERRCNALYGAPPKVLARKYRALRAAVALASDSETIDELMARGFYDQSHLIREIKQFTGLTPGQMRAEPNLLARMTISQRSALCGKVGPLISDT